MRRKTDEATTTVLRLPCSNEIILFYIVYRYIQFPFLDFGVFRFRLVISGDNLRNSGVGTLKAGEVVLDYRKQKK